jgi:23S rRNA pseudouridine2605 synthase
MSRPAKNSASSGEERLQKVLAAAGLGSRRQCEELILEGRVEVDRQIVTELGSKVDPARHEIRVDGEVLRRPKLAYYAVHKPQGVVSTARDPSGRPRVTDLLPPELGRLFPVGRLDMSSEGLMLLTNDGELTNELTHPRYEIEKTYHVVVAGEPGPEVLDQLRQGVHLAEGLAKVVDAKIKTKRKKSTILEIVLDEGRNREIRRLLAKLGHKVQRLIRVAIGPLRLGELPSGAYRPLKREEIEKLRRAATDARHQKKVAAEKKAPRQGTGGPRRKKKAATPQPRGRSIIGGEGGAVIGGESFKPTKRKPSGNDPRERKRRAAEGKKQLGGGRPSKKAKTKPGRGKGRRP